MLSVESGLNDGIAAPVVFALVAIDVLEREGVDVDPFGPVAAWTVTLSVVRHGFRARRLATWNDHRSRGIRPD